MVKHKFWPVLAAAIILLLVVVAPGLAQEQNGWSTPVRLSGEGISNTEGFMVSDRYGYVHVFWGETGFPDRRSVIQYARFDGETWSAPLDIYATLPGLDNQINFISPFIDQDGLIHLAWSQSSGGSMYYSSASVQDALSARNWSNPVRVDVPAFWVRLGVDSKGTIHAVYTNTRGEDPGIYYVRSRDKGDSWSDPAWLDPDIPSDYIPLWLQFELDAADGLHVVWNYLDLESAGKEILYANSLDGGDTWSLPFIIDEPDKSESELRMSHPGMLVDGQTVHVIWGSGTEETDSIYREYRYSTDAGNNWSAPVRIFGNLNGQAAGGGLAVDSAGRLHYVAQVRYPKAIWHGFLEQGRWTQPTVAYWIARNSNDPEEVNRYHAHNTRIAIRNGNQLVMTLTDGATGPLYAMHNMINDAPPLPTEPMPASLVPPTPTPKPTAVPTVASQLVPVATPPQFKDNLDATPVVDSSPAAAIWLAIVPAFLVVIGIVVFQVMQRT